MNKPLTFANIIKIEGQDNNISAVLDSVVEGTSKSLQSLEQKLAGLEMFPIGDNPRWFGASIYTTGNLLDNRQLDEFRMEFPNVDAEVSN